jgi:predicted nucleic acid-binding protein
VIVVDASVLLDLLLARPGVGSISEQVLDDSNTLHAPHLLDLEVAQVLRRYVALGEIEAQRGLDALQDLTDIQITRYPHEPFLPRIWELRENLSAYDAAYVALAETLKAPLITRDAKLAGAPGNDAEVELV